ncbi:Rv3654c family TadE-like protein [Streptomyces sp. B93]|uniref:Rv3654c family TadE-like protein n=1 Tax=Streptomyces sp. B93 TaxID=2824875 RepID=UPI001B3657F7|nr:flp pilus-assembly TadE/G-like family protein [Streptomyces sp. B93]
MRVIEGRGRDRGSATVWSVCLIAVLCVVFGVVLALGKAVVVRHRAAGGADLAALAAADHWAGGAAAACAAADGVAGAQGARLVRCTVVGEVSDVTAASGVGPFRAEVRARAGPAGQGPASLPVPVSRGQGFPSVLPPLGPPSVSPPFPSPPPLDPPSVSPPPLSPPSLSPLLPPPPPPPPPHPQARASPPVPPAGGP